MTKARLKHNSLKMPLGLDFIALTPTNARWLTKIQVREKK